MTAKQRLFVAEYLKDLNATQAAIRAGYSEKTARQIGEENLSKPVIRKMIDEAMQQRSERTEITQDRVLKALAAIGFGDIRSLFDSGGSFKNITELSAEEAALLAGFDLSILKARDDDTPFEETVKRIKVNDRLRALEMIGRHLNMFTDKLDVNFSDGRAERLNKARERVKKRRD